MTLVRLVGVPPDGGTAGDVPILDGAGYYAWGTVSGTGGLAIGDTVSGGTDGDLLQIDSGGKLANGLSAVSVVSAATGGGAIPWAADTEFFANSLMEHSGTVYLVDTTYTSGATFGSTDTSNTTALGGGSGGSITVTDGTNTETGITTLEVTSPGATVSSPSGGEAQITITSEEAVNTVSTGGTAQTIPDPWSSPFETISDITLTSASCALTFPTAAKGKSFTVIARQDATGGRLLTYPGGGAVVWLSGGGAPVLSTAANAVDVITFICTDGTHWLGAFTPGYSITEGGDDEYLAFVSVYETTPTAVVGTWPTGTFNSTSFPNSGFGRSNSFAGGSNAQNDAIAYKFPLSAGTYTINITVRESTNTGIATIEIDGFSVGTLDTYNAAATGALLSLTGITIGSSGVHEVRLLMATKNASSSGYALCLFGLGITRTA